MQIDCSIAPNVLPLFLGKKEMNGKKFKLIFFFTMFNNFELEILFTVTEDPTCKVISMDHFNSL